MGWRIGSWRFSGIAPNSWGFLSEHQGVMRLLPRERRRNGGGGFLSEAKKDGGGGEGKEGEKGGRTEGKSAQRRAGGRPLHREVRSPSPARRCAGEEPVAP